MSAEHKWELDGNTVYALNEDGYNVFSAQFHTNNGSAPIHAENAAKLAVQAPELKARVAELEELLEQMPVNGYGDMPTEKVEAIAQSGSSFDRPSARLELARRAALAKAKEGSDES